MSGIRIDQFLTACVTTVIGGMHPHAKAVLDAGGREVIEAKLREIGVTDKPVTLVDAARYAGILGPDPNVIDVQVVNPRRSKRRVPRV
jgi:hypothetical protein